MNSNHPCLSKCYCSRHGFCPVFRKVIGFSDWEWCQQASQSDRLSYFKILTKAPKTNNHKLLDFFNTLKTNKIDKRLYLLYYLANSDKYSHCSKSIENQNIRNNKILDYISRQKKLNNSINDVEILSLGHNSQQFSSIQDRPYLKKKILTRLMLEIIAKINGQKQEPLYRQISYSNLLQNLLALLQLLGI